MSVAIRKRRVVQVIRKRLCCRCAIASITVTRVLVVFISVTASVTGNTENAQTADHTVMLRSGDNIQGAVDNSPQGTTFILQAGLYRMQSVVPKTGDSFFGESGTILSGAAILEAFERNGGHWSASASFHAGPAKGKCKPDYPECAQSEDLFLDDVPLKRVGSGSAVVPGTWYHDSNAQRIFLARNPTGHKVEISEVQHAFGGSASNVTIRGLVIEKYATPAQSGAVHAMTDPGPLSHNWVVENNEIRLNHGGGIRSGHGTHILNNKIHHNGQMGIGGAGTGILVEGNEIDHNNYAGFSYDWEAGGAKFSFTNDLVVRKNFVHDNEGPGLWTDGDNVNALYEGNHITHNKVAGIFHEISFNAIIRNNVVKNDGFSPSGTSPWHGAGILLNGSSGVEIYGNTVINCMNGIVAVQAEREPNKRTGKPYLVRDNYIHENVVTQSSGTAAGIVSDRAFKDFIFTAWNNRFQNNSYRLSDPNGKFFQWLGAACTRAEWQRYGNDATSK